MTPASIRVVVIDDHLVTREGIVSLLRQNPNLEVVAEGCAGEHILSLVREHQPDVLLTDLQMPLRAIEPHGRLFSPVSTLERVVESYPGMAVIVISQEQDVWTIGSLAEIGVKGYFLKSDQFTKTIGMVVQQIHEGGSYFSPLVVEIIKASPRLKRNLPLSDAEMRVVHVLLRSPELSREVQAAILHISLSTFHKHITSIFGKLDVPNMESCLLKVMRMGLGYNDEAD